MARWHRLRHDASARVGKLKLYARGIGSEWKSSRHRERHYLMRHSGAAESKTKAENSWTIWRCCKVSGHDISACRSSPLSVRVYFGPNGADGLPPFGRPPPMVIFWSLVPEMSVNTTSTTGPVRTVIRSTNFALYLETRTSAEAEIVGSFISEPSSVGRSGDCKPPRRR
jgi:hypothetical protein